MSEEIFDCVYNWWTGFEGKETCEAGYMVCKEKECPMYCRGTFDNEVEKK